MHISPSSITVISACVRTLRGWIGGLFARIPVAARMALVPVGAVPVVAIVALLTATLARPELPVIKAIALPQEPSVEVLEVAAFAETLERIFGLHTERALQFSDWILEASRRQLLDPEVIASLIYTESSFRKQVRSWAGAIGPAQVKPKYWRDFCGGVDLLDPEHNIYCGAQVLAHYKAQCGELDCALRLYNVGPGNLRLPEYQQASNRYLARIETQRLRFDEPLLL